jgi:hypothetical protein
MQSNRWLTWQPGDRGPASETDRVIEKTSQSEPSKPTKPPLRGGNRSGVEGFGGFVGTPQGENSITRGIFARKFNGHPVSEIVWETPRVVVFRDADGRAWRRVHSWGMTWPITFGSGKG